MKQSKGYIAIIVGLVFSLNIIVSPVSAEEDFFSDSFVELLKYVIPIATGFMVYTSSINNDSNATNVMSDAVAYVANTAGNSIKACNVDTNNYTFTTCQNVTIAGGSINSPKDVVVNSEGSVAYIGDNSGLLVCSVSGSSFTCIRSSNYNNTYHVQGLMLYTIDGTNYLYTARHELGATTYSIGKYTTNNTNDVTGPVASYGELVIGRPVYHHDDSGGYIYGADSINHIIFKFNSSDLSLVGEMTIINELSQPITDPIGIYVYGNIFYIVRGNNTIHKCTLSSGNTFICENSPIQFTDSNSAPLALTFSTPMNFMVFDANHMYIPQSNGSIAQCSKQDGDTAFKCNVTSDLGNSVWVYSKAT